jgi:hypothetical protein
MSFSIRSFVILWRSVPMVNGKLVFSISDRFVVENS